jgi:hypothetical protein
MTMPISDQTFRLTKASFVELVKCEATIAGFVNDTMTDLSLDRNLPSGGIGFNHWQVDIEKRQCLPAGTQLSDVEEAMAPDYPTSLAAGSGEVAIVEASGPIVLAQKTRPGEIEGIYRVSSDQHLLVFGDVVTIRGKVAVPGKHVVIFARELRTLAYDDGQKALLDTSAPELLGTAKSGLRPAGSGGNGSHGQSGVWRKMEDGSLLKTPRYLKRGPIGPDVYPKAGERAKNGEDGEGGAAGSGGGDVFIVTDSIGPYSELTVCCSGREGGGGQQAQNGGVGGDGGTGRIMSCLRLGGTMLNFTSAKRSIRLRADAGVMEESGAQVALADPAVTAPLW